ncbi:alpha/beta hydrolase [Actinocrispum sp. NPDC049592]|uniref:alpha/beta fold hydrolase n=1 Tax=Actinocrispum sp. NPDC049592 TaxID=3154835 RepID=UPI00341DCF31
MRLEFETFGDSRDPALVLIMGLGAQLIDWQVEFCEGLVAEGFHVVRFDNRDVGLSDGSEAPYVLADMAADTVGLLDRLGIERAHVVGVSMGGMIAQQLVIDHPGRVLSLCSIMSTTGDRSVGRGTPEALAALTRPAATSREQFIEGAVRAAGITGSPGFETPVAELEERAARKYDRAYRPEGTQRQLQAVLASPDRTEGLRNVTVPALVIHGEDDPLVGVSGGRATAEAIPGAELMVIPGMGHDLPRALWPHVIEAITANARRETSKVD